MPLLSRQYVVPSIRFCHRYEQQLGAKICRLGTYVGI